MLLLQVLSLSSNMAYLESRIIRRCGRKGKEWKGSVCLLGKRKNRRNVTRLKSVCSDDFIQYTVAYLVGFIILPSSMHLILLISSKMFVAVHHVNFIWISAL
jgi:hypothetical protein